MNHVSDVGLLCTEREMDEEDHKAVLVELVYKFLSDRGYNVAVKGVLDLRGELQCPYGDYSRIIASIRAMGARYEDEMDRACTDLGLFRKDYATRFQRALSRVIVDGITWGRVLIAFNFTALVAGYCAEHRMDEKVSELVRAADIFMRENCVYEWIVEQGGWDPIIVEPESGSFLSQGLNWLCSMSYTVQGLSRGYCSKEITT